MISLVRNRILGSKDLRSDFNATSFQSLNHFIEPAKLVRPDLHSSCTFR
jgi:hypothetical protein